MKRGFKSEGRDVIRMEKRKKRAAVQEKERGKVQVTSVRLEERNGMHITVPVQIAKYRQGTKGTATFFSSD